MIFVYEFVKQFLPFLLSKLHISFASLLERPVILALKNWLFLVFTLTTVGDMFLICGTIWLAIFIALIANFSEEKAPIWINILFLFLLFGMLMLLALGVVLLLAAVYKMIEFCWVEILFLISVFCFWIVWFDDLLFKEST